MPAAPFLTLVDPRAQRRSSLRQRFISAAIGAVIAGACAIPFVMTLGY